MGGVSHNGSLQSLYRFTPKDQAYDKVINSGPKCYLNGKSGETGFKHFHRGGCPSGVMLAGDKASLKGMTCNLFDGCECVPAGTVKHIEPAPKKCPPVGLN